MARGARATVPRTGGSLTARKGRGLRYDITDAVIVVHLEGQYSVEQLLELIGTALADPRAPARARVLIDARTATTDRSIPDVHRVAAAFATWAPRIERLALVAGSDAHYGLMRMGAILAEEAGLVALPFRDLDEARAFLEAPDHAG